MIRGQEPTPPVIKTHQLLLNTKLMTFSSFDSSVSDQPDSPDGGLQMPGLTLILPHVLHGTARLLGNLTLHFRRSGGFQPRQRMAESCTTNTTPINGHVTVRIYD